MLLQEVFRGGHEIAVRVLKNFPAIKDDRQEILKALKSRIGRKNRKRRPARGGDAPCRMGNRRVGGQKKLPHKCDSFLAYKIILHP